MVQDRTPASSLLVDKLRKMAPGGSQAVTRSASAGSLVTVGEEISRSTGTPPRRSGGERTRATSRVSPQDLHNATTPAEYRRLQRKMHAQKADDVAAARGSSRSRRSSIREGSFSKPVASVEPLSKSGAPVQKLDVEILVKHGSGFFAGGDPCQTWPVVRKEACKAASPTQYRRLSTTSMVPSDLSKVTSPSQHRRLSVA
jgi:hypothetical protein